MPAIDSNQRVAFLRFCGEARDVDLAVKAALALRKELRGRLKEFGFDVVAFDAARKAAELPGELREHRDREYRRNLEWLDRPVGDEPVPALALSDVSEEQQRRVAEAGELAARGNYVRASNPWSPGSLQHQIWDSAWERGHEDGDRPRGRPRGALNKPRAAAE